MARSQKSTQLPGAALEACSSYKITVSFGTYHCHLDLGLVGVHGHCEHPTWCSWLDHRKAAMRAHQAPTLDTLQRLHAHAVCVLRARASWLEAGFEHNNSDFQCACTTFNALTSCTDLTRRKPGAGSHHQVPATRTKSKNDMSVSGC